MLPTLLPILLLALQANASPTMIKRQPADPTFAAPEDVYNLEFPDHNGECTLALWNHDPRRCNTPACKGYKVFPFRDGFGFSRCVDVTPESPNAAPLVDKIAAFQVGGACNCEFFADLGCQNGLFTGVNRADYDLGESGNPKEHRNNISSWRCRPPSGSFIGVYTEYGYGGASQDLSFDSTIYGQCWKINDDVAGHVRSLKVGGSSCLFYDNPDCAGEASATAGGLEMVEAERVDPIVGNRIKSFKCLYPLDFWIEGKTKI
ncbi:hypothetical protein ABW19_dt0202366 [Dactylella cylindrospora]|nr:hypothetical protein ABW19_dt0202366 [Dactylella cylindrospora]